MVADQYEWVSSHLAQYNRAQPCAPSPCQRETLLLSSWRVTAKQGRAPE